MLERAPAIEQRTADNGMLVRSAAARSPFGTLESASASQPSVAVAVAPPPAPTRPKLIGTVVDIRGGFVMLESIDGRVQLVHIGEKAGDLRLRSVTANQAIFEDASGSRVSLRAPVPGSDNHQ